MSALPSKTPPTNTNREKQTLAKRATKRDKKQKIEMQSAMLSSSSAHGKCFWPLGFFFFVRGWTNAPRRRETERYALDFWKNGCCHPAARRLAGQIKPLNTFPPSRRLPPTVPIPTPTTQSPPPPSPPIHPPLALHHSSPPPSAGSPLSTGDRRSSSSRPARSAWCA